MSQPAHRDRTGSRLLLVALGLVLAFLAAGAGIWWYVSGRFDAAAVPLKGWEVPGLRVGLPQWAEEDVQADGVPGHVTLTAPGGSGRYLEIRWNPSAGLTADEVVEALTGDAPLREEERHSVQVDGRPSFVSYLEADDARKRVAFSLWRCPESGLAYQLTTFVDLPRDPLMALHERILGTAGCAPLAAGDAPEPIFPVFDAPEGFKKADEEITQVWEGGQEGVFDLAPGTPGRRTAETLKETPALRAQSARAEFGLEDVHLGSKPVSKEGPGGAQREVYVGQGMDKTGNPVRVLMTWFYCPDADRTFLAFHAGPPGQGREPFVDALVGLRCPEPRK
ncbi:MAG: hypothetical protein ACQEXJ_20445 [Myxococcota bacterium]